jgi:hypothetical protein
VCKNVILTLVHLLGFIEWDINFFAVVSTNRVCELSGRVHDQTTHRRVHRTHIHIDDIRPHTKKANDEANSGKVVNALSTKDNP